MSAEEVDAAVRRAEARRPDLKMAARWPSADDHDHAFTAPSDPCCGHGGRALNWVPVDYGRAQISVPPDWVHVLILTPAVRKISSQSVAERVAVPTRPNISVPGPLGSVRAP